MKKAALAVVLNTVQATAGDLDLLRNVMTLTGLGEGLRLADLVSVNKETYAAGTASVKTLDVSSGISLVAEATYRLKVFCSKTNKSREYTWTSGASAPTAANVATALAAAITADQGNDNRLVSATSSTADLVLTLLDVDNGDFQIQVTVEGAIQTLSISVGTAYVAPTGTFEVLRELTGLPEGTGLNEIKTDGQYTTYETILRKYVNHNEVGGAQVVAPLKVVIAVEEGAANAGALVTAIDAVFGGTHTPATDYDGVPSA
jgi:hypothetical protein